MILLEITMFLIYKLILKATENMSFNKKIILVIVSGVIIQISYTIRYKFHLTEDFIQTISGVSLFMIIFYYFVKDAQKNNKIYYPPYSETTDYPINEGIESVIHSRMPKGYTSMPKTDKGKWWKSLTGDGRRSPRKEMIGFYTGKKNRFLKRW